MRPTNPWLRRISVGKFVEPAAFTTVIALTITGIVILTGISLVPSMAEMDASLRSGAAAFGDWRTDHPGIRRLIKPQDLPAPDMAESARNAVRVVHRTSEQKPIVPNGFEVNLFASGLHGPRIIRTAPNGDIFVAESSAGRISVLRPNGTAPARSSVFATGLDYPFGVAFYPPGNDPQWIYVGNTDSVVRFPYRNGDLTPRGEPDTIVPHLSVGGHRTRDVAFSPDGKTMYVSVGSGSNVADGMTKLSGARLQDFVAAHPLGATWGSEAGRADVLAFDAQGKNARIFATGIRNCVGLAVAPNGTVWCSTNERDGLGDNVPPDYVTRVGEGAFYGWPWYYIGAHEDPRRNGERPDLAGKITLPDVLLQAHSASLGLTFYDGTQFPAEYRGNIFAAQHGSWNRGKRTGYKVIRVIVKNGVPTGEYDDFATGFVIDDATAWGRPVGVTVDKDGALLISEDGSGTIWRVIYAGKAAQAR